MIPTRESGLTSNHPALRIPRPGDGISGGWVGDRPAGRKLPEIPAELRTTPAIQAAAA